MTKYTFLEGYRFSNGLELKNRIVMAPMTTMSSFHDGHVTTDEVNYYHRRGGGPGMIITAVANVSEDGKGFEGAFSATDDRFIPDLTKIATAIKQDGTKAVLQIFHAGRMSNSRVLRGKQTVSASAIAAERRGAETPRALTEPEIEQIIEDFGEATLRAIKAGFDGVELHGANTYLLQQFVSPHSNRRTDQWGGSFENRIRFPLAVVKKVQEVIKEHGSKTFLLGYRVSPEEFETPGIRLEDTFALIEKLKQAKIDYLHVSIGHISRTSMNDKSNSVPIVEQILAVLNNKLPLIGVGSMETPADVQKAMDDGLELVALGRELIREPQWVQKVMMNDEASIRYTIAPTDFEELAIPRAMETYLTSVYKEQIHLSTDAKPASDAFLASAAPMEGYKK